MSADRYVMVSLNRAEWFPRKLLADLGPKIRDGRYITVHHASPWASASWDYMKPATARDLLELLPGGWDKLALKRVEECPNSPDHEVETLHEAVDWAIHWDRTPEGYNAWESLCEVLRAGTEIPPVPEDEATITIQQERENIAEFAEMLDDPKTPETLGLDFERSLCGLLNRHSIENDLDMPDFILAKMICDMLKAIGPNIKQTLDWHGCDSVCHPARKAAQAGEGSNV